MLRFRSLGSGSSGNATLIEAHDGITVTRLVVDCGFGLRQFDSRLARVGLQASQIDALFVTHEHADHVGCARQLCERDPITLLTSHGTWTAMGSPDLGARLRIVRDLDPVAVGGLAITPFTVPHDAREPLQLRCTDGDRVLGVLTDLGQPTPHVLSQLEHAHALLLECNHDPDLLSRSGYPAFLKRRVAGGNGHLSNAQAADIASRVRHSGLGAVVAAHLSQQNNRPELALAALAQALERVEDELIVASAEAGTDWIPV
jgi:phosphoribosyl 1,2-cyclic phosphodiesterase